MGAALKGKTASTKSDDSDDIRVTTEFNREKDSDEEANDEPPPLPPSPGRSAAEGWFDAQPTFTDPRLKKKRSNRPTEDAPIAGASKATEGTKQKHTTGLLLLVAAASLAVGLVIGAVALGGMTQGSAADCECAE